jgi:hypothetical protein
MTIDEYRYDPALMSRQRIKLAVRTLFLFATTICGGLLTDQLPAYRNHLLHWEMGAAFLFTLPTIGLALITYWSGWQLRKLQSESQARYRCDDTALIRECPGESPERLLWTRLESVDDSTLSTRTGGVLPFYPGLIVGGDSLLAEIHSRIAQAARNDAASR